MKIPTHLKHKPIIVVNDYEQIDSIYANHSDVRALSIGEAQYDNKQISLKVWRHTGKKWSRQNEEIPIHRNIDLTILLLGSLLTDISAKYPTTSLREEIINETKVLDIQNYYKKNENSLKPRLEELKSVLDKFLSK
ncbi:MAG: DUF6530 family protein [Bacteroidetes bacterium]|nr:DUF6530 family protein [Bacteroidota bacterium]